MDRACLDRALARVPYYAREHVLAYLYQGTPPSGFLRAVLENSLHGAGLRADDENQKALLGWAAVLDALPMNVWGSRDKVDAHLERCRERREENVPCKR